MLKDPQTLSHLQLYAERYARALKAFSDSSGYNKNSNNRGNQFYRGNFGQHRVLTESCGWPAATSKKGGSCDAAAAVKGLAGSIASAEEALVYFI